MPAAWARMIYVCGFLQDKGVLYRIRRRNLHGFLASLWRQEVYALGACRAYARLLAARHCIIRVYVKNCPALIWDFL